MAPAKKAASPAKKAASPAKAASASSAKAAPGAKGTKDTKGTKDINETQDTTAAGTKAAKSAKSADTKSDTGTSETAKSDTVKSDTAKSEAAKGESTKKGAKKAGATIPGLAPTGPMWDHFDEKFLESQRKLLLEEREQYTGSAEWLQAEARQLTEEYEPGDVQFDDESGEGDSIVVERERDLALSAQALQIIAEIDAALRRLEEGTYGISEVSGLAIPKERLKAIPWTTVRVEEKVGGIGHRR